MKCNCLISANFFFNEQPKTTVSKNLTPSNAENETENTLSL
jgi:hypothetical protein